MAKEVERKFLSFDKEKLLKRMAELGFRKVLEGKLYSAFYSPSLEAFKKHRWIRVREIVEEGKAPKLFLAVKDHKFLRNMYVQEESEWELNGPSRQELEDRLRFVGLKLFFRVEKRREAPQRPSTSWLGG